MTLTKRTCAVMFGLCFSTFLTACGEKNVKTDTPKDSDTQAEIPGWLEDFYNGSYEFIQSRFRYDTGTAVSIMSGKKTSSPYVQYVKVLQPQDSLWSEAYYYGEEEEIEALVKTASGYVTQKQKRGYPYGYGEKLIFSAPKKESLGELECDVYETEYTVDLAEQAHEDTGQEVINEPLSAVIPQKYYVDPKQEELIRIDTDLRDLTEKSEAFMFMQENDISAEEALKKADGDPVHEIFDIIDYDDNMSIEIPEQG